MTATFTIDYHSEIAIHDRMIDRGILDRRIGPERMESYVLMDRSLMQNKSASSPK